MWRINEFGGLTKQVFCGGEGVYMVSNYCCSAELYDLVESNPNPNTKTARQTAVKSPNDGGF